MYLDKFYQTTPAIKTLNIVRYTYMSRFKNTGHILMQTFLNTCSEFYVKKADNEPKLLEQGL